MTRNDNWDSMLGKFFAPRREADPNADTPAHLLRTVIRVEPANRSESERLAARERAAARRNSRRSRTRRSR